MQYRRATALFFLSLCLVQARPAAAQTAPPQESPQQVLRLQNFGTLCAFLNLASGTVRVLAVMEPSSPDCVSTIHALQAILDANPSKRLRAYIVWTRASDLDTEIRALSMANEIRDRRLSQFWDAGAVVETSFRSVLGAAETPATGVVLLYDTDARLALDPPAPSLWMSANPKLAGAALDPSRLGAEANAMVRRVEAKVTDGTPRSP